MNNILATDKQAFAPGVDAASGRVDWDAAHAVKALSFNPDLSMRNGNPAIRRWNITPVPAGDTYTYDFIGADGQMHTATIPTTGLDKPNFAGLQNEFQTYDAWLAAQPMPRAYNATTGASLFEASTQGTMKMFYVDQATAELVYRGWSAAGIPFEVVPDDGDVRYGDGSAKMIRVKVNGGTDVFMLGYFWKAICKNGVGFPYSWVPNSAGQMPALAFDMRITATVTEEWPVPNIVPVGYKPALIPVSLPGLPPLPGFVPVVDAAPVSPGSPADSDALINAVNAAADRVISEFHKYSNPGV